MNSGQVCRRGTSYFINETAIVVAQRLSVDTGRHWCHRFHQKWRRNIYFSHGRCNLNGPKQFYILCVSDKRKHVQKESCNIYIIYANVHIPFRTKHTHDTVCNTLTLRVQMWVALSVTSFLWGDFPSVYISSIGLRFVLCKIKSWQI